MDRRRFLKTSAVAVTALSLASCENKPRVSKWIAFKDQMPGDTDKFEIRNKKNGRD